jgi:uncharacterized GH25 family protein
MNLSGSHRRNGRPCFASLIALVLQLCGATPVVAHDFWLQPSGYWLAPNAAASMTLQVGHGPFRQRSPISLSRITRFSMITPEGAVVDLRGHLHPGGESGDGDMHFQSPGAYALVLETDDRAESHLPALRFNDYLNVEGITPALKQRARTHRTDADGSERYSRRAKAIVQIGPAGAGPQSQVTKPLGLPLEIVPEQSPYAEPQSDSLPVRVLYEGRPLSGALVKLTNLEHDTVTFEMHLTDRNGHTSFTLPRSGTWLLNVIWTKPLPGSRDTDFETIFSSLSFGFPAIHPASPLRPSA